MSRVALIEDHARLAGMIRQALAGAGIEADIFGNLSEAHYAISHAHYALLILDRGLPDGDGLAFLRKVREAGRMIPCLMLTARDALHDRIDGLETGADDYVTKPFAMSELVARVRTLMRRPVGLTTLIQNFADIVVDPQQHALHCADRSVTLAPSELQIMLTLLRAVGQTVPHVTLEHAAWGLGKAVTPNALEVTIHRLRKKLLSIEATTRVVNVRGAGFALQERD
ncbi:response regulator transcription factor [Caballeronia sordidicola]|uniref:Response regulators consisting of a CheY-like receiver domain and a winged-helix DNA-binding domain n=1 Tax=Caballeronia sordidicola TaxID=196367 RepID=A0A242M6D8_CABSO|nr:response regulator transcription factor [Caballeronia sordidicola]OTP66591.1 Response regulators consisting of a CheY-like receiver domain and a winged-helix DNA-binding domain [Caballeronia sordidicola]